MTTRTDSLTRRTAPIDLAPDEFRALGHRLVDAIADWLKTMPTGRVTSGESVADIRRVLGSHRTLPESGEPAADVLADATTLLVEHSLFNGHPRFFGYITSSPAPIGALGDLLVKVPELFVFGEDVATKGGVYYVTHDLSRRAGIARVFNTLLDEQSILGLAIGAGQMGCLAVAEIQYLAYLHNAEDQLRGEAATMQFFSQGAFHNPMVVRVAGLAYQLGFGGHFHNDNGLAVLRDIPGLVVAVPSRAEDAAPMLRTCLASAIVDGSVCIFVEPIAPAAPYRG